MNIEGYASIKVQLIVGCRVVEKTNSQRGRAIADRDDRAGVRRTQGREGSTGATRPKR
jgi:hypothetical protein